VQLLGWRFVMKCADFRLEDLPEPMGTGRVRSGSRASSSQRHVAGFGDPVVAQVQGWSTTCWKPREHAGASRNRLRSWLDTSRPGQQGRKDSPMSTPAYVQGRPSTTEWRFQRNCCDRRPPPGRPATTKQSVSFWDTLSAVVGSSKLPGWRRT
jgi:hypothetical protein